MAAPSGRMASRPLLHYLSCAVRQFTNNSCLRGLSLQTKITTEGLRSPWTLMAAVCLQRLPVISVDPSPMEQRFGRMLQEMELEKSILSDHELRLHEDAERLRRKQSDGYNSDDEDYRKDQDIVLAQDLEDSWEQKLKSFQPAPRVVGDVDKDLTSTERCLADSLVLVAEQQVGGERLWMLPQAEWREGETLRHTAERALASLPAAALKATFLGNAPCGVYKYKLPKAARTDSSVGVKVFFFKAVLPDGAVLSPPNAALMWLRKKELQRFLKPAYSMKVERFLLGH
ncbi:39S ribosomal protein L46, mitochondrial [Dunckerocampus dactyliophorus]|uniref:39S ribosomal protein L46, mitochondrial n=1 Tax=Dunckerocampus dactyliophorus TaxID=161453 RepID=UPI0024060D5A|nr:39S ribosomal protein L46, mitochondrial [Dunckerocampus dactyliophorus]